MAESGRAPSYKVSNMNTRFELIALDIIGTVHRTTYDNIEDARVTLRAADPALIFGCVLRYLDDADMSPDVVIRTP